MPLNGAIQLLIVEDNPGDVRLMKEALRLWTTRHCVHVADDGAEAIDFLRGRANHGGAPRPDLVMLDINLPQRSGIEVLCEIKQDPALWDIAVIMFSSSASNADIRRAYECHANCYIVKPSELDLFFNVLQWVESFWLRTATLAPAAVHTAGSVQTEGAG
jgi:CheY-like chemotaxis protein